MKLTGLIAVATFIAGAVAQTNFDLSTLNGTWHAVGLQIGLYKKMFAVTKIYGVDVNCPRILIAGHSTNASYIEPAVQIGIHNNTSSSVEKYDVSASGVATLANVSDPTTASFSAQLSIPSAAKGKIANHVHMLDAAFSGGSAENPLPHGPDYQATVNIRLVSSKNDGNNDAMLLSLSDISKTQQQQQQQQQLVRRDRRYQALLVKDRNTLDEQSLNTITTNHPEASGLVLVNMCSQ
ncbi:hypothetical protein BDF20DRAFT_885038 [Mycotypha africana]|uniref:uncharacterized protein n=1 Tax=Mycotypha africana TaxID=64632 RepID=UPI002300A124|nr:uncharacterized protein BDF20DRAFT_885038 [Mycotypha africana]KAI8971541.1 hypothetical protein BDF20DRAFT_885038 [Mycotypha africana]